MAWVVQTQVETKFDIKVKCLDDKAELTRYVNEENQRRGLSECADPPLEIVPRNFVIEQERLPDWGFFGAVFAKAVDDRFRDVIEELEPSVHRFIPITVRMKDGRELERPHFLLNCRTMIDAVNPEKSDIKIMGRRTVNDIRPEVISLEERDEMIGWSYDFRGTHKGLVLEKEQISGRALWWDYKIKRLLMSDAAFERVNSLGVEGFRENPHIAEH